MQTFLLIGTLGLLVAGVPIWIAIIGGLLQWDKSDPSWGAALPFMLFYTIPGGLIVSIIGWMIQWAYSMWG